MVRSRFHRIAGYFLVAWLLLAPQLSVAAQARVPRVGCPLSFVLMGEHAFPEEDYKAYAADDIKTVVFLSDGPLDGSENDLAFTVARRFPKIKVTKADLVLPDSGTHPEQKNLTVRKVNNQQELPFESDSADRLVMRHGMCLCEGGGMTCGGIPLQAAAAKKFFMEVGRVLNKKNPHARAYLEGPYGQTEESLTVWRQAIAQANQEAEEGNLGFRVELVTTAHDGVGIFRGIQVKPVERRAEPLRLVPPLRGPPRPSAPDSSVNP